MAGLTSHSTPLPGTAAGERHPLLRFLLWIFQLPGNLVADRIGASSDDDRMTIRILIGMLFWNLVIVILAWIIFTHLG